MHANKYLGTKSVFKATSASFDLREYCSKRKKGKEERFMSPTEALLPVSPWMHRIITYFLHENVGCPHILEPSRENVNTSTSKLRK
jgi:hypothetical protein